MRASGKDYYGGGYSGSKPADEVGPPPREFVHEWCSTKDCSACNARISSEFFSPGPPLREFDGGATRDTDSGKYDYEGFLSPAVLREFARYMHKHRQLPDGTQRGSDNWQAGMPKNVYIQSLIRHVFDLWLIHRGEDATRPEDGKPATLDDALGGIQFNLQGFWLETLRERA